LDGVSGSDPLPRKSHHRSADAFHRFSAGDQMDDTFRISVRRTK